MMMRRRSHPFVCRGKGVEEPVGPRYLVYRLLWEPSFAGASALSAGIAPAAVIAVTSSENIEYKDGIILLFLIFARAPDQISK